MQKAEDITIKQIWRMVAPSIKKEWKYIPMFFVFAMLTTAISVSEPYIYGRIIDIIIEGSGTGSLSEILNQVFPFLAAWGGVLVGELITSAAFVYLVWLFGNIWQGDLLNRLYQHILRLDLGVFEKQKSGEVAQRYLSAWHAFWMTASFLTKDALEATFRFIFGVALGLFLSPMLTLVTVATLPFVLFVAYFNYRISKEDQDVYNTYWEKSSGYITDTFANIKTVKSYSAENRSAKLQLKNYFEAVKHQLRANKKWAIADGLIGMVYTSGRLAIFVVGIILVTNGSATIGTVVAFIGITNFIYGALERVTGGLIEMTDRLSKIRKITHLYYTEGAIQEIDDPVTPKTLSGAIELKDVSFRYTKNKTILNAVNLTIEPGSTVAIVGESGAGKSTLVKLLMRFYDVSEGAIMMDGHDIRDMSLDSLRGNIGFVMQEHILFHETIEENIRYAKPNATKKEILAAAKRAQAHGFIEHLEKGYKTIVGDRGIRLSGGEKQRIALARVFLEDPPILILDEATSALDSKTEHELQMALEEVMKDRTSIVIAHRLSTVMQADMIIVMDEGKIVDSGKHADLIKKSGPYKEYWQIQAGGYV